MNSSDEVALLRDMLEIESLSGRESALAAYLHRRATAAGFSSDIDRVGNVHMEIGSGRPHLLMLGHMDTVAGTWPVTMEGESISARGAVDAKGSLAAFVCAAARLAAAPPARITVVGAVEEETFGSRGARHVRDLYQPDVVLIGEPSGWDGVTVGYKGCTAIEYVVDTSVIHSAGLEVPAVELAVDLWNDIRSACAGLSGGKSAFNGWLPRLLDLSTHSNGFRQEARFVVGVRTPPGGSDAIDEVFASLLRLGTYRYLERVPAALYSRDDALPRSLRVAIRKHGGVPALKVKTGTSDMNVVAEAWTVPMCAYGPGDSSLDHTPQERLSIPEYQRSIAVLCDSIGDWAGTSSNKAAMKNRRDVVAKAELS
jgi:LysW-gamma-L-lysine carboxypeptidase